MRCWNSLANGMAAGYRRAVNVAKPPTTVKTFLMRCDSSLCQQLRVLPRPAFARECRGRCRSTGRPRRSRHGRGSHGRRTSDIPRRRTAGRGSSTLARPKTPSACCHRARRCCRGCWMVDVRPSAVARLLESEARECVPERVAICHLTVGPAEPDHLRAELDECAEPLLALAQGLIGQVAFDDECGGMGDVRDHLEIVGRRARGSR